MSKSAIDAHAKEYSKGFDSSFSPWKNNYIEMAKKTIIKKTLKYAPVKADFGKILAADETVKKEIGEDMSEIHGEDIWDAWETWESKRRKRGVMSGFFHLL